MKWLKLLLLRKRLKEDSYSHGRQAAADALGEIGSARAVEPLIEALEKDPIYIVQMSAAHALGKIGDARAVEPLIEALNSLSADVRNSAGNALVSMGECAMNPLVSALKNNSSHGRQWAASVLGAIKDARAVEPLVAALKNSDSHVRQSAADALGKIGDARAVEPLIGAISDRDQGVRDSAAEALSRLGGARVVEPLVAALKNSDSHVRQSAADALSKIGDARAVEPLIKALKDYHVSQAADALGKIGDARAVEPLIEALKDHHVSDAAANALGNIGNPRAVEALIAELNNRSDVRTRRRLAEVLVRHGNFELIRDRIPHIILDSIEFALTDRERDAIAIDAVLQMLAKSAGMDRDLLDLAFIALGHKLVTKDIGKYESRIETFTTGEQAIVALCARNDVWSSCILYRVLRKKDLQVSLIRCGPDTGVKTLSFEAQRQAAKKELIRRGLGDVDPITRLRP